MSNTQNIKKNHQSQWVSNIEHLGNSFPCPFRGKAYNTLLGVTQYRAL